MRCQIFGFREARPTVDGMCRFMDHHRGERIAPCLRDIVADVERIECEIRKRRSERDRPAERTLGSRTETIRGIPTGIDSVPKHLRVPQRPMDAAIIVDQRVDRGERNELLVRELRSARRNKFEVRLPRR